jgi:hypothetical protein
MSIKKVKDVPVPSAKSGAGRAPVKAFRVSDVSASIFAREYNGRTFHSVSFTRSYKDASGAWKYVKSFDVEDLGKVVTVAQQSAEWLHGLSYPEPEARKK